jgi:flagellar basal-body rod modification protein FlgD
MKVNEMVKKEDFLRLFVTQLRYQNPLNPLDGAAFTAQLAEFSSLEQLVNMNQRMDNLLNYQDSLNNALATGLIGRYVSYRDDIVSYSGQPVEIRFTLQGPSSDTVLRIYSTDGQMVREINLGPLSGTQTYTWDGLDSSGQQVPEGSYRVEVVATDANGQPVEVIQSTTARVTGVEFSPEGVTYLVLENGERLSLGEIESIMEGGVQS